MTIDLADFVEDRIREDTLVLDQTRRQIAAVLNEYREMEQRTKRALLRRRLFGEPVDSAAVEKLRIARTTLVGIAGVYRRHSDFDPVWLR